MSAEMSISGVQYTDYLSEIPTFISLDISIRSTGWVKSVDGVVTFGTKTLSSTGNLERRKEFKQFILNLFGDIRYPIVIIEDVWGGENFNTVKGLIQLNTIVDDLKDDGLLHIENIIRIDNMKWKKFLKQASGYDSPIKKADDKEVIKGCMHSLNFTFDVIQDIYDAMGMAVAVVYRDIILPRTEVKPSASKLNGDLKKGYTIKQVSIEDTVRLEKYITQFQIKYNREVEQIDWTSATLDLLALFKKKVAKEQRDNKIYVIKLCTVKMGVIALKYNFDIAPQQTYLVVTKTKKP